MEIDKNLEFTMKEAQHLYEYFKHCGFIHPRKHAEVHKIIDKIEKFIGIPSPKYDDTRRGLRDE